MAMRSIIIALFLTLAAFAQEMDTTYIKNEQGQTVGIIHEKGTVPVIPKAAPAQNFEASMAREDSISRIRHQYERFTRSAERSNRLGRNFMIGGGICSGLGTGLLVLGYITKKNEDRIYGDDADLVDPPSLFYLMYGSVFTGIGIGVFITGYMVKLKGRRTLRRVKDYEEQLRGYGLQHLLVNTKIVPMINPIEKAFGGNLLLDF